MIIVSAFNPISNSSGTFIAQTLQNGGKMIVHNKSYVDIELVFPNGIQTLILANDRRAYGFNDITSIPNPVIQWTQLNIDYPQTVKQLENVVYVEVYQPSEQVIETYPSPIQREPTPNLIPYNIGYGGRTLSISNPSTAFNVIYPSSYVGLAVAPSTADGLGYDFLWLYQNLQLSFMSSIPGLYAPSTGKAANNATPNDITKMSYVPGPFSQPGLTPVDTATHCNGTHWGLTTAIPWASSTSGYLVEAWIKLDEIATGGFQPIFGDDGSGPNNAGVTFYVDQTGKPGVTAGFSGSHFGLVATQALPSGWVYVAWQYTGTVTNTFNIYINGQLAGTGTTNGTPVNTVQLPRIGASFDLAGELFGSIAYVGVLLSGPGTGQGSPAARYEHGQQSLNVDNQRFFLTKILVDVWTTTATTTIFQMGFQNFFNPAGLLYVETPAAADQFHLYNTGGVVLSAYNVNLAFSSLAVQQVVSRDITFTVPLITYNTAFITISGSGAPVTNAQINVFGYGLLSIG